MAKDLSLVLVSQKAISALEILADGDGPLKYRLFDAWQSQLSDLEEKPIPQGFRKRFDEIAQMAGEGCTIEDLTPEEARVLAMRIVHFALDLQLAIGAHM